jgi:pimeloyl-ACP methyl ester carboxylesterase
MAQWIARLMDAAGIEKAALVGHSMGGAIAVEAAAAFPHRITRIALLGTSLSMPVNATLLAAAKDTPDTAHRLITGWSFGPRAKVGGNPAPGLWMSGGAMALLARNRPGTLYAAFDACNRWTSGPEAAARVHCPALVIIGASDSMTPPRIGRQLAEKIAGSRTVVIPNSGHMLFAEAPDAVLDALIEFFAPAAVA